MFCKHKQELVITWKTVVNESETVRAHSTARDATFYKKEQAYLQFLDTQECCFMSELLLQFKCNNATQYQGFP